MKKLLLIGAGALVIAPPAAAKLCSTVATTRPLHPVVGERVDVRLTTWMPKWVGYRAHFGHYASLPARHPLRVHVTLPQKASFSVRLRRDATRPWLWRGSVTLRQRGLWTLAPDPSRWGFAPRSCARRHRLAVV